VSEENVQLVRGVLEAYVALLYNQRQRGRHSGIWTDLPPYAQVFTVRDGKLVRWRTFPDQYSALNAVGLA
jgi:hypothetical protein